MIDRSVAVSLDGGGEAGWHPIVSANRMESHSDRRRLGSRFVTARWAKTAASVWRSPQSEC